MCKSPPVVVRQIPHKAEVYAFARGSAAPTWHLSLSLLFLRKSQSPLLRLFLSDLFARVHISFRGWFLQSVLRIEGYDVTAGDASVYACTVPCRRFECALIVVFGDWVVDEADDSQDRSMGRFGG